MRNAEFLQRRRVCFVPDEMKVPMYLVTNSLDQKDVVIAVCNTVTSAERPSCGAFDLPLLWII